MLRPLGHFSDSNFGLLPPPHTVIASVSIVPGCVILLVSAQVLPVARSHMQMQHTMGNKGRSVKKKNSEFINTRKLKNLFITQ